MKNVYIKESFLIILFSFFCMSVDNVEAIEIVLKKKGDYGIYDTLAVFKAVSSGTTIRELREMMKDVWLKGVPAVSIDTVVLKEKEDGDSFDNSCS